MPKIIALQSSNQLLIDQLQKQGYQVMDLYEAHKQRAIIDIYLYTTYHPDAFTLYPSFAENSDIILSSATQSDEISTTIMLNITQLEPDEIIRKVNSLR